MEFEKPKTDHLVLKPKVVDPTDKPSGPGDESRISVQKIHAENVRADADRKAGKRGKLSPETLSLSDKPLVPEGFKHREIEFHNEVARPDDDEAIRVHDILLENRLAEERSGWGRIKRWRRRKSRRGRDFLLVVGTIDLCIGIVMKTMPNIMTVIYGISAITLATSVIGWIMFVMMDPY